MKRKSFVSFGAIGLLVSAFAVTAYAVVVSGPTKGDWDLPNGASNGSAAGALFDSVGNTVFKMKATLVEVPSPALSIRNGYLKGELDDGVAGYPIYTVYGKWVAKALTGTGEFKAEIYKQVSPLGPIVGIGVMEGVFKDPPSFPNRIGAYEGKWKADI